MKRKASEGEKSEGKKSKSEEGKSESKIWRWGILSTGKIAQDFVTALEKSTSARVVACGSRTLEDAQSFATKFKIPRAYGSYEGLASDEEVDIIYVATPHIFHKDNVELALNQGKHVLCEKPLTINAKEAEQLISLARAKKLFLMEALWTRFIPSILKVRELLNAGAIGDVKLVEANFGFKADRSIRRLFEPALAGGALLDIGIYPVNFSYYVFGPKPPSKIFVTGGLTDTKVDEHESIILKFGEGQLANLNMSLVADLTNEAIITGTKGRLKLDGHFHCAEKITITRRGQKDEVLHFPIDAAGRFYNFHNSAALRFEAEEVHRCLDAGLLESPSMTLDESLSVLTTMDHVRKELGVIYPTEIHSLL